MCFILHKREFNIEKCINGLCMVRFIFVCVLFVCFVCLYICLLFNFRGIGFLGGKGMKLW